MFERIIAALDGSDLAERVLPQVEALAEKFGSSVVLLRATLTPMLPAPSVAVAPDLGPMVDLSEVVEQERAEASAYLVGVAARLRQRGLAVETVQTEGDPAQTLLEQARALGADLIAMTTHGRGGLGRLVYGSVADAVLRHAPCPILLVRIAEEAGGAG